MILFALSWYTGKPLDLQSFLVFAAPILTHAFHIVTDSQVKLTTLKSSAQTVQEGIKNGRLPISDGPSHA
jgi:hypothetical protein